MTIKIGDKVRWIGDYDKEKLGKIGIFLGDAKNRASSTEYVDVWMQGEHEWVEKKSMYDYLELVETATYVPLPKFRIGDVVYDRKIIITNKYLILEERTDDFKYHCWSYANGTDEFMFEEELTLIPSNANGQTEMEV
jgi:hypothetical protein